MFFDSFTGKPVDWEDSFLGIKRRWNRPPQKISLLEDGIESTFNFQDVGEVPGLFNEVGDSGSYEAVLLEESEPVGTAFIEFELVAQQPNGDFIAEVENFLDFGEGNTITLEGKLNVQRFEDLQPARLAITDGEGTFDDARGVAILNQVELDVLDVINIDLLVI